MIDVKTFVLSRAKAFVTEITLSKEKTQLLLEILLVIFIGLGIAFRFSWLDWSQGTNLHPDEYGLTNTLTQLHFPNSLADYFNTRISPLSPYQKYDLNGNPTGYGPDQGFRWGQWPVIIIRWFAEVSGDTGYNELRLMGRGLSALADSLSILLVFLTAQKLFNRRIALLTAALSSLAALQIQQSHFMTVDNFAVLFTSAAMYSAAQIATTPNLDRKSNIRGEEKLPQSRGEYRAKLRVGKWYLAFGVAFGMAVASRINLLPLGGMILVAAFTGIADLKLTDKRDLNKILQGVILYLFLFLVSAFVTFRVTQPMSFRNPVGDTSLINFGLNPDWVNNMQRSVEESNGYGGGPPAEQWANRPRVFFPWMNMVIWGMGLPLGITAWAGLIWAAWRVVRFGDEWRSLLLPLAWAGGFFIFMATRWASSIRYYLPVYPFLILFAAWLLDRLLQNAKPSRQNKDSFSAYILWAFPRLLTGFVLVGTFIWAYAFVRAVYMQDHTRIQASRWIFKNIPATFRSGEGSVTRTVISNESWDEGLPLLVDGFDPAQLYTFKTMEVRWYDDENKRKMFLDNLDQVDYIILPSQRAVWSTSRILLTYPMTMAYYRALFDGRLGFDLLATFTSPMKIGPIQISDVGGTVAWGKTPDLPLFNDNLFAAEEAFSVYDHPPVWIFKKRSDFNIDVVKSILYSIDLSKVVIQSPREATKAR